MRERGGRDQCRILDANAMMHFIAFLETAQDGDGILHAWLFDHDWLEASFEAASFSMYLRYSSSVVAPMVCSSPRASGV